ncbi:MAG: hypothetical protein GKC01_07360 [Candidatus Methanofastidiosa archaeon]|nr:hypothetical protein [Candidatus Methanofastidiosa archaeon]
MLEQDKRRKKVALVANCLLNQNAKVNGFAFFPDMLWELVEILHKYEYGILQLPCPETVYAGLRRWWYVREQYDNAKFRDVCKEAIRPVLDQVEALIKDGCKVVLIGLDGSPSCGVRSSGSDPRWGGKPEIEVGDYPQTNKSGIFIEVLKQEIHQRGLPQLREIGAGFDMPNFDKSKISKEIEDFLKD